VRLVDRFNEFVRSAADDWTELRLELTINNETRAERAAALLAPANPGRLGRKIRFAAHRGGRGLGPEAARRLLARLDEEGISGELKLAGAQTAPPNETRQKPTLGEQWNRELAALPADWSDLYAEVTFDSTDYVEPAALLLSPINPSRSGPASLRFRSAQSFGYGASQGMTARSLERCDDVGMTGELSVLRVLSDTEPVGTQGPVWIVGGKVV
jgi:hypothetical protein